jgi:hypothetical protein
MQAVHYPVAIALSVVTLGASVRAQAPSVPTHRLGTPTASSSEPFTEVESVVDLGGDVVLVVDSRERRLVLVDFGNGTARPVGRSGAGPGEFRLIARALPRPDGGAWIVDFGLRRLLPVNRDGTFGNPILFPTSLQLRSTDASGALYGEAFLPRVQGQSSDSMYIVRWNPMESRIDTLMKYNAMVSASVIQQGGTFRPFAPVDAWDVLPNGDVIVIEAERYRMVVYRGGRSVRTTSVVWTPLQVTDADKDAFRRKQESQRPMRIGSPGATPSASRPRPPVEFPATFPPFGGKGLGGRYTTVSPGGQVLVQRLGSVADSVSRYDVIDGNTGALVMRVELPARSHLVGFGPGVAYFMERDADDVLFLRRFAIPAVRR